MIHVDAADKLLNFAARIGEGPRAREQLEGAVALHHMLSTQNIAYLADEVGMGKTYVALGALALFRHFDPSFRVLVIAPRENIQSKWIKELKNFVSNNVRFPDLRVKALDGRPVRGIAECDNLMEFVEAVIQDPHRDFFMRMSSFSLPVGGRESASEEGAYRIRDRLLQSLPWLDEAIFDLRSKQAFKDNIACAICCALPVFDLVIVDEAHNLKHGFYENTAARNRVLGLALGRDANDVDTRVFRGYGPRAKRVLFLSATPIEDSYSQLWNQLNVFGHGKDHVILRSDGKDEDKKARAKQFLIRRVTALRVHTETLTKNLYRRPWTRGGVEEHDKPVETKDARQRLVVALVQKKVSEVLQDTRFNASFQIGMLASFESFLETPRVRHAEEDASNFDQTEQTTNEVEREGIDVEGLNHLARSYRATFHEEMPHPKMDALVAALASSWVRGEKALVFVRRVASVKELKRKLDECYDRWIRAHLKARLGEGMHGELDDVFTIYRDARTEALRHNRDQATDSKRNVEEQDAGGVDTFFAWFFRGEGPARVLSGARVQQRLLDAGFFEDNYAADLLACEPGRVLSALTAELRADEVALRAELQTRATRFLGKSPKRVDRLNAMQAAAIELLSTGEGTIAERARVVWRVRFAGTNVGRGRANATDMLDLLEARTFFTEVRQRPDLLQRLWPTPHDADTERGFRERELRAQLLGSACRLGHSLIDLFVLYARRVGGLARGAREERGEDRDDLGTSRIQEFLDLLEEQRRVPREARGWGAFDELSELSAHHDLIVETNAPDAKEVYSGNGATKELTTLLRKQQPVGGMSGQVNKTLVRQFRMPGYPLVLVSTELLQEGEDLHTFCASVHHYGISGTPSAMEQRIGRVDRVRSQTDRRLSALERSPKGDELLQVYFPHLEDTVEVLQVQRVLERMDRFVRLMHEGLEAATDEAPKIDTKHEFARGRRPVPLITARLETAFPVRSELLDGTTRELAVDHTLGELVLQRFSGLRGAMGLEVTWEPDAPPAMLLGTAKLDSRRQPFSLHLRSMGPRVLVRCVSPVGRVSPKEHADEIAATLAREPARVGAVLATDEQSYDLTVEDDVLLADDAKTDAARVALLIRRTTRSADALERAHLPGKDEPIETFRGDLEREGGGGGG